MASVWEDQGTIGQEALLALLDDALRARGQSGWSRWLQCELQAALPHHTLIAAWGDFQANELAYDVIMRSPALPDQPLAQDVVEPLMRTLYGEWTVGGLEPRAIDTRGLRSVGSCLFDRSPCVLVHGVQDRRSRCDCLYAFIGPQVLDSPASRWVCRMALPYIDTAFRQLADRGRQEAAEGMHEAGGSTSRFAQSHLAPALHHPGLPAPQGDPGGGDGTLLSVRELEIMQWVRIGKTNAETAMILGLSMFTVKNHMRRIYRKLDVMNRAQAVGSLDNRRGSAHQVAR